MVIMEKKIMVSPQDELNATCLEINPSTDEIFNF